MRKTILLVAIVIVVLAAGVWYFAIRQKVSSNPATPAVPAAIDTSNWKTYTSAEFGFLFKYPPSWQKSNDVLTVVNSHIFFGDPLNGTTTYELRVFVLNNPQHLAPKNFVDQMIAADEATDSSNSAQGPAPQLTPQFSQEFAVTVGAGSNADNYSGYELDNVFAFDESDEQIYVQQNKQMLQFIFPVADENPNIADAEANNAIVHQMLKTLVIDPNVWKFCGGIATIQCASGYSCELEASYPQRRRALRERMNVIIKVCSTPKQN